MFPTLARQATIVAMSANVRLVSETIFTGARIVGCVQRLLCAKKPKELVRMYWLSLPGKPKTNAVPPTAVAICFPYGRLLPDPAVMLSP